MFVNVRFGRKVAVAGAGAAIGTWVAVTFGAADALADVSTTTYEVGGTTLAEVWQDIGAKGFREGATVHAGQAESSVGSPEVPVTPACTRVPMTACEGGMGWECTASMNPAWTVETTITLPNWPGAAAACAKVKAEWERFLAALRKHEEGHDAVAQKALADAKPASPITSDVKQDCDKTKAIDAAMKDLAVKYEAELDRIQKAIDDANAKYDADTGHGATQGATLDTDIVCDPVADDSPEAKLKAMIDDLDLLDDDGLRTSLQKKLANAIKSIERENLRAAKGQIDAFIREVKAQRGKALDAPAADGLVKSAQAIKKRLE